MSEGLNENGDGDPIYRVDEDYSIHGSLPVEEYIRKGQEIKSSLERIVADVKSSGSALEGVEIKISLTDDIRLAVIPRTPIDICHEDFERLERTLEPTIVNGVTAKVSRDEPGEPALSMEGRVLGSEHLRAEFDPLAGHELLAFEKQARPGVRQEGGIRLTSSSVDGQSVLDFTIY